MSQLPATGLARARHMLESTGRFPGGALPRDIADSWLRSLANGLDPLARSEAMVLDQTALRQARDRHEQLMRFARPEMEMLYDQISGSNFMIALGSPDGMVLETLSDQHFLDTDAGRAVIPASLWTEAVRGTNALGLSLATGRPAQVYGGEHFFRCHADVSCISAPIHDGRGGIAGILDASSGFSARQQHTAALVQMSAANIENCLLRADNDNRIVLQFHPRPEYLATLSAGILVLEDDFSIRAVNRKGLHLLAGIDGLVGRPFDGVFEKPFEALAAALVRGETLRLRDRLGSMVAVRCVANRRAFGLAGARQIPPARTEPARPAPRLAASPAASPDGVRHDPVLRDQLALVPEVARRGLPIHLFGETGTGKELAARHVHAVSGRSGAFVPVNCGAVPDGLFVSELFGYAEGAFTDGRKGGADGLALAADGGTLFLDEVADIPPPAQSALLRFLDAREVRRVGETRARTVDVQIVSATNVDLAEAVAAGRFRRDLMYRLQGYVVALPRLADRSDFDDLVAHLLAAIDPRQAITAEAVALLRRRPWAGNVRELKATLTLLSIRAAGAPIDAALVEADAQPTADGADPPCTHCTGVYWKERQCRLIRDTVRRSAGNISEAARQLGLSRTTLYKHLLD